MPLTVPAHQAFVLPAKVRWPHHIDGTALFIGAAAPDVGYTLEVWLPAPSHHFAGVVYFGIPYTVLVVLLLRWRSSKTVFAHLGSGGPLKLTSYRVLGFRGIPVWMTVACAAVGAFSHVIIDSFTHAGRRGANWLGLNDTLVTLPVVGERTEAGTLQYLGHSLGSAIGVYLLLRVIKLGVLEATYGHDAVARARRVGVRWWHRIVLWSLIALGGTWFLRLYPLTRSRFIFGVITVLAVGLPIVGVLPLYRQGTTGTAASQSR